MTWDGYVGFVCIAAATIMVIAFSVWVLVFIT
jgi:hypothetical protein